MAGGTKRLKKVLVGKLALKANFITQDQLDEVIALQKRYEQAGKKVPSIGELLAHKGYLTKEQVIALLKGGYSVQQGLFGEIAQRLKFATAEQVQASIEIQRNSSQNGRTLPVGQVMISQGQLRPNQILAILRAQGKSVARCVACGAAYNVPDFQPGQFTCAACEGVLLEVKDLESAPQRPSGPATKKTAKPLPVLSPEDNYSDFLIENKLGSDPLGDLYLATDPKRDRPVLIRIFDPSRMLNPTFKKRLLDQSKTASKLDHPNIQKIVSLGKSKGCYYLATEHVRGETLADKLRSRNPVDYSEVLQIFAQTVDALQYAHDSGLVHGDIRPANIMIGRDGQVRLQGLAIPFDDSCIERWFKTGKGGLQALYMAPEQVSDQHETDERTDVFALGCTVYHALTGLPPYKGKSPADLLTQLTERGVPSVRKNNHAVPNEAADVISKMLAVEPSDRHQSMKELKQVVDTLPKDVEKQVASIDYSAVLGDAATATPAAGTQAQRRKSTQATTNAAVKTTSSESSGKMKTVGKMSYAELVSQMSDEAAEADEAESQHKGPKSLIELTGKTGSAYRSLEAGEGIRIPRPFKIAGLLCLLCAAAFGAYVGLKSQSEQKRINAVIQKVVEKTKTPPKIKPIDPGALKERRKLAEEKRLREVAEAYAKALKMVEKNNLDGAINELKRGVLEPQGLGWKYLGDAYNLSMRAHFYKVYTDKFDEMSVPAKLGYLSQAKLDQKKAAAYYRQPDQQTQFKQSVKPWMPEYDEQFMRQTHSISPFWDKADRRRRSKIFYHGKIKRAGRDMRTWAMVLTNFKLD